MDAVAMGVTFLVVAGLALGIAAPLSDPANPSDTSFTPVPEWYFLFYYQLLKYMEGPWEIFATVVLPVLFYLALFLLPWLDRRPVRRPFSRRAVVGVGGAFLVIVFVLLTLSFRETASLQVTDVSVLRGKALYKEFDCAGCHRIHGTGEAVGPDLSYVGDIHDRDWHVRHFRNPKSVVPGSEMPAYGLSEQEMSALASYMMTLKR